MASEELKQLLILREEMASRDGWCPEMADEIDRRLGDPSLEVPAAVRRRLLDIAKVAQFHRLTEEGLLRVVSNPGDYIGITSASLINGSGGVRRV